MNMHHLISDGGHGMSASGSSKIAQIVDEHVDCCHLPAILEHVDDSIAE
jgi:hypothetical protein